MEGTLIQRLIFWILTALVAGLFVVVWFAFTEWKKSITEGMASIGSKIDKLIDSIQNLTKDNAILKDSVKNVNDCTKVHENRINKLAERVRELELKDKE